jgi:SAM-dependent methyltransferase
MFRSIKSVLAHPLTRGLLLDDAKTTVLRFQIIQSKPFLRRIYDDWYTMIRSKIPEGKGLVLELGSGAGHFQRFVPDVIRSEVFLCPNVDLVTDARFLPFPSSFLKAIVMTDVFHHIPQVDVFLREAVRCLVPGGRIAMVEPWVSAWSRLIYGHFHHEPFRPGADSWEVPSSGPLSCANGALPWIVLVRDRERFISQFPELHVEEISPMMPFRYLASGGVSMRNLMPRGTYCIWRALENAVSPWVDRFGMFALICLRRK